MEGRLGDDPTVTLRMTITKLSMIGAALLAALSADASRAQDLGVRPLRYGTTSGWYYDNRDDSRDFTSGNGFFPGNFTADPPSAWLGATGALAGNSYRSPLPYPSQVVIGPQPACAQSDRVRNHALVTKHDIQHRC
jgi:hypothetical protein